MTSEQVRIALTANAVTRSTRTGFDFEDPCGKTLDEFTKGATLQCLRVAQQMQQPGFEKVLAAQIFPCYTIANWNQTKVIYDFGKDFLELLMDTDDLTIHREVLERLPFKNFYVPLYNSVDYCGMFVHIEFDTKTDDTFVGIVLVGPVQNEKENVAFLSLPAWIKEGQSLTEATRSTKQYIEKASSTRDKDDITIPETLDAIPSVYGEGTPYVRLAMLCAYYLASKGAKIRLDSPKKDERPVFTFKGQTKKVNIKTFVVGHYLMERYKKEANGKAPTWRHYWCGNGRERRECKFSF